MAIISIIALTGLSSVYAEQLTIEYSFECPQVREVTIAGVQYHRITMADAPNCGLTGQPALPVRGARILLPAGAKVADVKIVPGEKILLGSGYYIEPTAQPVRLSADPSEIIPPVPDETIKPVDVVLIVNYVYLGFGDGPCNPCGG